MATNFKTIISSFRQHGFGNCTSIGVIKAAIEVYGIDEIFEINADEIKLKNGEKLVINSQEFLLADQNCGFLLLDITNPETKLIRDYAIKCFAVICKSKQNIEEYHSYQDAIDDINNGEGAFNAPEYLGLEDFTTGVKYHDANDYGGIVAHSPKHTVYVSHGYFDDYGTPNLPLRMDSVWQKTIPLFIKQIKT